MKNPIIILALILCLFSNKNFAQTRTTYLPDTFQVLVDDFCMLEFHLKDHTYPRIYESIDTLIHQFSKGLHYSPDSFYNTKEAISLLYTRKKFEGDQEGVERTIKAITPEKFTELELSGSYKNDRVSLLNFEATIHFPLYNNQLLKLYLGSLQDLSKTDSINFDSLTAQALDRLNKYHELMKNHRFSSRTTFNSDSKYNPANKSYLSKVDTAVIRQERITYESNMELSVFFKPGLSLINNTLAPNNQISMYYINKKKGVPNYSLGLSYNSIVFENAEADLGIDYYSFLSLELFLYNNPSSVFNLNEFGFGVGRFIDGTGDMYPDNSWTTYLIFAVKNFELVLGGVLMNPKSTSFKDGWIVPEKQQSMVGVRFRI